MSGKTQECLLCIGEKMFDLGSPVSQECFDGFRRTVAEPQPYDLGRVAENETPLPEVGIFGHDGEPMLGGVIPDDSVVGLPQPDLAHVNRPRKQIGKCVAEPRRNVLVE